MLLNHEKQTGVYKYYAQLPLTARPLDLLYFLFFAVSHNYYRSPFVHELRQPTAPHSLYLY